MLRKVAFGCLLASIVPVLAGRAAANVLVVDPGGGGNYTTIQAAIDAALSGDTILVRTGNYSAISVPDKTLSIVAYDSAQVSVGGASTVGVLSSFHTVVLAGLILTGPNPSTSATTLTIASGLGPIRLEGCTITGSTATSGVQGHPAGVAVRINGSAARVAFVGCTIHGGNGGACDFCDSMPPGTIGLYVDSGRAALYDCNVSGGSGGYTAQGFTEADTGGAGGIGAYVWEGFLHASNSTIAGGDGGYVLDCPGPTASGPGGDGLHLAGPNPLPGAWSIGASIHGGASPHIVSGCAESLPGAPGQDVVTETGAYFPLSGSDLEMEVPALVREGHDLVMTIHGQPGTLVDVVFTRATQFNAVPSWRGVVLTRSAPGSLHPALYLGAIPASGVITDGITVGDLPAGVTSTEFFLQARGRGADGRVLGSFAALTVLDSAY